jgi:hypothetical protein
MIFNESLTLPLYSDAAKVQMDVSNWQKTKIRFGLNWRPKRIKLPDEFLTFAIVSFMFSQDET